MPTISSALATNFGSTPLVREDQRNRLVGTLIVFNTAAKLADAVAIERQNIVAGLPLWPDFQPLAVVGEFKLGIERRWNAAGQHARDLLLRPGLTVAVGGDSSAVLEVSGAPSGGSDGDIAVNAAAGVYYEKAAGSWSAPISLYPSSASLQIVFDQPTPAATWVIAHGLDRRPPVATTGLLGEPIHGAISYPDANTVSIEFSPPAAGHAYVG